MSNILVTGANGQLGTEIKQISEQHTQYQFFFTNTATLNITNFKQVHSYCSKNNINIILNCAAYTNVEQAEENIENCFAVNHLGTENLSKISKELHIQLIHISTDYVFNGSNTAPYLETDSTNPLNVYGASKLKGEESMLTINPKNSIIIRTSWVYSSYGNNFVKSMLKLSETRTELRIVADQFGTPTYAADLAKTMLKILPKIQNSGVEIYHYSNQGTCSWCEFAKEMFHQTKKEVKVLPISTDQYPTKAKRPLFSILDKSKIKNTFGIEIPHWKQSLTECLNKI